MDSINVELTKEDVETLLYLLKEQYNKNEEYLYEYLNEQLKRFKEEKING